MGNQIYTIGREFGSAGYEVGRLLAERLGVKLYDNKNSAQAGQNFRNIYLRAIHGIYLPMPKTCLYRIFQVRQFAD